MENKDNCGGLLRLYQAGSYEEIPFIRLEKILTKAKITRIPGAPENVAGMMYWQGRLIVVYGSKKQAEAEYGECLALIKGEDGAVYGMAADEITGGEELDTLYG